MQIKRGDIFWVDLSPVVGNEEGGIRPALVVQSNTLNADYEENIGTVIVAPITSRTLDCEKNLTVDISNMFELFNHSVLLNHVRAIDKSRLREYLGNAGQEIMKQVDEKLKLALDI